MKLVTTKEAEKNWDFEKHGEHNKEWIRPEIFFIMKSKKKSEHSTEFRINNLTILRYVHNIIDKLENRKKILESFFFTYQPRDENRFKYNPKCTYFTKMIDLHIRVKTQEDKDLITITEETEGIISKELEKVNHIVDYGFWHFGTKHTDYCSDPKLFYDVICKIYEYYCRFLFKKLDPESSKNLENFNNMKIIHRCNNSQGMSRVDETFFGLCYARMNLFYSYYELANNLKFSDRLDEIGELIKEIDEISKQILTISKEYKSLIQRTSQRSIFNKNAEEVLNNIGFYFPLIIEKTEDGKHYVVGEWRESPE